MARPSVLRKIPRYSTYISRDTCPAPAEQARQPCLRQLAPHRSLTGSPPHITNAGQIRLCVCTWCHRVTSSSQSACNHDPDGPTLYTSSLLPAPHHPIRPRLHSLRRCTGSLPPTGREKETRRSSRFRGRHRTLSSFDVYDEGRVLDPAGPAIVRHL